MADVLNCSIKNDFSQLAVITPDVNRFLEELSISDQASFTINFALEELLTNIIKYGYDDDGEHQIDIRIERDSGELIVTIQDDGHEFDPLLAPSPDFSSHILERQRGGLGLHLLRGMAKSLDYQRDQGRNTITVRVEI